MSSPLRVAFVGAGSMARAHLEPVLAVPGVEVVAFADPNADRCEARARELRALRPGAKPERFADPVEMLASTPCDVAYIVLPPFAHGPAERTCLERGIPFFIEKPVGLDMGVTREIAAEVATRGLLTCAGYMNRYREGVQMARAILRDDPAVLIHGGWIGGSPDPKPDSWWPQRRLSGGQIVEQSTHTFDLVRFLAGEAVEVFALGARGFNVGLAPYDIEDASAVGIRLASGGIASLMACCAANGGGGGVWLNVYGHDSTFLFSGWEHNVQVLRSGAQLEK
ncbi:MAG: Gfo/Idh/MocA family oxidoreductase, partial [Armatimonadetes bacterium]|nr:Gfo/Idh/MocA family oxidoreductase [Armatimonadota bacterium]